ncbi:MAG: ferredoxin, partial [Phycisphaerae bacterium]
MAKREVVTKVWIEEGCIVCDACETTAPDVFDVKDETCIVKPAALDVEFTKPRTQSIIDAAEECPVDVIKFETAAVDVPEDEGAPEASAPQAPAPVAVDADAPSEATVDRPPEAAAAPVPTEAAGAKVAATAAEAASAQKGDESIQALLGAAAMRGGHAAIVRKAAATPDAVEEWKHRKLSDLPPDARQARILEAAKKVSKVPHMQRRAVIGGAALTVGWTAFG